MRTAVSILINNTSVEIAVKIDIEPGEVPNPINPRSQGVIPVAILTTDTFDAITVDSTTVRFGAIGTEAAPVHAALEDVDRDGDTDMILHFRTQDTGTVCGDTSASLTGDTFSGPAIEGSDSIRTVGVSRELTDTVDFVKGSDLACLALGSSLCLPNNRLHLTASSLRSYLAPAPGGSEARRYGCN